jgi:hypothetical protein
MHLRPLGHLSAAANFSDFQGTSLFQGRKTYIEINGGERGSRTPGEVTPTVDFESTAFDHSAISPGTRIHPGTYSYNIIPCQSQQPNDGKAIENLYGNIRLYF